MRLLVVEDSMTMEMIYRSILEKNQGEHDVWFAPSGHEALVLASKTDFHAILMDDVMPGISGFETAYRMRQLGVTAPIILMTSGEEEKLEPLMESNGINCYCRKSLDGTNLLTLLELNMHDEVAA